MNYRDNIIEKINLRIKELEEEVSKYIDDSKQKLLEKFLKLKNDLSQIINFSDEEISIVSNLLDPDSMSTYNTLIYIKTIENALSQGISFIYEAEELKFLYVLFEKINNKIISNQEILNSQKEKQEEILEQLKKLNNLKEELADSNNLFQDIDTLIILLKDFGMKYSEINDIIINLITDNYYITTSVIENEKSDINTIDILGYLKENNIDLDEVEEKEQNIILSNQDVPYILDFLKDNNLNAILNNKNLLLNILAYSSKQIIDSVNAKFGERKISLTQLNIYPTILIDKGEQEETVRSSKKSGTSIEAVKKMTNGQYVPGAYNRFMKNMELVEKYQIDLNDDSSNIPYTILNVSTIILEDNIKTATVYGLLQKEENKLSTCLRSPVFKEIVDMYIEQGAYYYILKNKSRIAMYDKNLFHRMYYARKNGIGIYKESKRSENVSLTCNKEIFSDNVCLIGEMNSSRGFGINLENADMIISRVIPDVDYSYYTELIKDIEPNYDINNDIIRYLDSKYKESEYVYNIDGVLLSRLKFIRNINALNMEINYDTLMYSLTLNTILNETDLNKIELLIQELLPRKKVL